MVFNDFEYDGVKLSDLHFMICSFDSGRGMETVSYGGDLTFNKVSEYNGKHWLLTNSLYEESLTATFSICPDPCYFDIEAGIDDATHRTIMRWLNKRTFAKFKPIVPGSGVHFFGSFVVKGQLIDGKLIGYELTLETDRPFGIDEPVTYTFTVNQNGNYTIMDTSDEIGHIYPRMEITPTADGTLNIWNSMDDEWATTITDCVAGELIILDHPMVSTSSASHKIQQCFDYNFPRICNTFLDNENILTFSLPCTVRLTYSPIRKVGL